jgi:hypothetical protein
MDFISGMRRMADGLRLDGWLSHSGCCVHQPQYDHNKTEILAQGFTQLVINPCLFFKAQMCVACYVDDCGITFYVKNILMHSFLASATTALY